MVRGVPRGERGEIRRRPRPIRELPRHRRGRRFVPRGRESHSRELPRVVNFVSSQNVQLAGAIALEEFREVVGKVDGGSVGGRALHWVPIPMPMGFGCAWVGIGFVHPCIQFQIGVKFFGCREYAIQEALRAEVNDNE